MTTEPAHPGLRVKICGLTNNQDARAAQDAGADLLGFVLTPGFSRSVPMDRASDVVAGIRARRVAVLVDETADRAEAAAHAIDADVLQLHGDEDAATVSELRARGPWSLWKAVRARTLDDVHRCVELHGDVVDGILVEGWKEGIVGGGGVRLALEPSSVRGGVPEPLDLILAGGLTPQSVGAAVARFRPDVVDVSSGVERSPGHKSRERVEAFIRAARGSPPVRSSDG